MRHFALHWQILIAVVNGAVIGAILNVTLSERHTEFNGWSIHDGTERIIIEKKQAEQKPERWIVEPTGAKEQRREEAKYFYTLDELKAKQPAAYAVFHSRGRSLARRIGDFASAVGGLFLRLLRMVSVPLIVASLLTGIMGLASAAGLRRLFSRTLLYYLATSTLAITTGLVFVNLIRPGERLRDAPPAELKAEVVDSDLAGTLYKQLQALIPDNPIAALAQSEFLSIIAFSLIFGLFAVRVGGSTLETLHRLAQAVFAVMMALTMAIVHLAPFGVFFLLLAACATQGLGVFQSLGLYMLTVLSGLLFHACFTLPLILHFVAKRNPFRYSQAMSPALLTAFSSASSNATLPLTMTCVEERAGISNRIASFVLPLGATINMDGTALFEAVAVLFIAQLEPTVQLSLSQQIIVAITALLASIGAAGIPHAGLVMMVIVLQAVGLPTDKIGLILAVDRILDMFRTSVNVWSDMTGCAVIERFEMTGQPDQVMQIAKS